MTVIAVRRTTTGPATLSPAPRPLARAKGSLAAHFERVILPHESSLYGPAFQLTRNASDAEDLVQDTLLRAYSRFGSYREDGSPRAWLHTIMRNLFINGWRKKSREPQQVSLESLPDTGAHAVGSSAQNNGLDEAGLLVGAQQSAASPERVVLGRIEGDALLRAVGSLPAEFRDAILLADVQELSYGEIAARLGVPVGTVRSRLSRGRKRVQRALSAWQTDAVSAARTRPAVLPA